MEAISVSAAFSIIALLLTFLGLRHNMRSDYVQSLERRLALAEERAERAEEGHDKCDEDKEALKRVIESSERENNQKDRLISELYSEIRNKDRQIRTLGGTPQ